MKRSQQTRSKAPTAQFQGTLDGSHTLQRVKGWNRLRFLGGSEQGFISVVFSRDAETGIDHCRVTLDRSGHALHQVLYDGPLAGSEALDAFIALQKKGDR